jgi:hypothetical protein
MPGGYRKTHTYPQGKPFPLVLLNIAVAILFAVWLFVGAGSWPRTFGIFAIFLLIMFIDTKLHRRYEQTGQAVSIPQPRVVVKFPEGLPALMLTARIAFFVTVAILVIFGVAPMPDSTAWVGIIACVFALIGVAVLNITLEHHYVRTGCATEEDVSVQSIGRKRD